MKSTNFFCLVLMAVLLTNCTNETTDLEAESQMKVINFTQEEHKFMDKLLSNKSVSQAEAIKKATDCIFNQNQTRSGEGEFVKSEVLTISSIGNIPDSMAMLLPDTIAYVFHSADSMCTLVPADNRVSATVLGVVSERDIYPYRYDNYDFSVRDIILENLVSYTYNEIEKYETEKDSMEQVIRERLNEGEKTNVTRALLPKDEEDYNFTIEVFYTDYSAWDTIAKVGPLLNVAWDQCAPYGDLVQSRGTCNDYFFSYYVAPGCGSIAAGMLMAYWQYPSIIHQYNQNWTIDWNSITSGVNNLDATSPMYNANVGCLIGMIAYDVTTSYGCVSSTNEDNVIDWLYYVGYQSDSGSGYNYNNIVSSLNNGCPVLMFGHSTDDGHAWITDGYKIARRSKHKYIRKRYLDTGEEIIIDAGIVYEDQGYLNHNWGTKRLVSWLTDGCFDEYYYEPGYSQSFHNAHNYNNNMSIYTNIRPITQ